MTNYEKIKAMSVEEVADFLNGIKSSCCECPAIETCEANPYDLCGIVISKWLESEAEEDG